MELADLEKWSWICFADRKNENIQRAPKNVPWRFPAKICLKGPILLFHTCSGIKISSQRWANNSVFEYIRIVWTEYIRKPNYSMLFKNRIIFVFVFGRYFQTEYIRIRIRLLFFNRIYSYSYSLIIFQPNIFVFVFGFC